MAEVGLPMYDFPALSSAHDALWSRVSHHLGSPLPPLPHNGRTAELWKSPNLLVAQTCGYPLISELNSSGVQVLGAFEYDIPSAAGPTYCSQIISKFGYGVRAAVAPASARVAVNSRNSLSGWLSLVAYLGSEPKNILETGAHRASIAAVMKGEADLASIDAVTFRILQDIAPEELNGIEVIGQGPRVPCLPLIAGKDVPAEQVVAWRDALAAAVPDKALYMRKFHVLERSDYENAILPLVQRTNQ